MKTIYKLILCLCCLNVAAQTDTLTQVINDTSVLLIRDSSVVLINDTSVVLIDSLTSNSDTTLVDSLRNNPGKAMQWSAIFPGGGQVYNRQYWKVPIFTGLVASSVYLYIDNTRNFNVYGREIANRKADPNRIDIFPNVPLTILRDQQLTYKRRRSLFMAATLTSYGFNILDAFATANIRNSDLEHSPFKAAYYSAIFPGLGQIYNRKYWKLPLIYGGFAAAGYYLNFTFKLMDDYSNAIIYFENPEELLGGWPESIPTNSSKEVLSRNRERILKRLELTIILTSLWYVVNILDATVDGHLNDFEKEMDAFSSIQMAPSFSYLPNGQLVVGYGLVYRF